jgi:AcrR family transcriptional regulator
MELGDHVPSALRVVPQQNRAAATVQRVLRAALIVLRRTPMPERDGIAMEEIAREARTSLPAVYRYFAGVDDVYAALVQREQARILQQGLTLLAARRVASDGDVAATLVDFFIHVFSELLRNPGPVLYLIRHHHEVGYGAFEAAAPQVRAVMQRAGLLEDRILQDIQIVTALSGLASAIKAVMLRDGAYLADPTFRDRMVRLVLGVLDTQAGGLVPGEPIDWTYDLRQG